MILTKFSVNRPVTTTMLFIALVFFGITAYNKLGVNLVPDVQPPVVMVTTILPGATPEEVEGDISNPIEKEVSSINNIKSIKSYSMESMSMVIVEFKLSKDNDKALSEVKEKIDLVLADLPSNIERPVIQKFNPNDRPVLSVVLSGDISGKALFDIADKELKNQFLQIEGVSKAEINGGEEREIKVIADKRRMYEVGLNLQTVSELLQTTNTKLPAGSYNVQHRQFSVETGSEIKAVNAIDDLYLPHYTGPIAVKEFAHVVDTVKKVKTKSTYNDIPNETYYNNVVSINIRKLSNANAVQVASLVHQKIAELKEQLPQGVELSTPFDWSVYTKSAVEDAQMNVILGIILTGFILFFFLGDFRTVIIVSISIPVSLVATFAIMNQVNASLNMMTLMSFAVAIGALISNSIVVIENILRHKKEGKSIKEAAIDGTSEVVLAVIASTGTNLVVFLPIASMTTVAGAYFKEYAITISVATVFSLLVSFTLTPMLASVLFKKERKESRFSKGMDRFFSTMADKYGLILQKLISKRWKPIVLFIVMAIIFVASAGLMNHVGFNFLPKDDSGALVVECELPAGTNLKHSTKVINDIEQKISAHPEVKATLSTIGYKNNTTRGSNFAKIEVKLYSASQRQLSNYQLVETFTEELQAMPDIIPFVSVDGSDEGMPVSFVLQSNDNADLSEANRMTKDMLSELHGVANYESSFREGNQVIRLIPKGNLLASLGITTYDLALAVRSSINGIKAGVYKEKGKEYDITVSFAENTINDLEKIRQIPIFANNSTYTVEQLVDILYDTSQSQIFHVNKKKTVEFGIIPDAAISEMEVQNNIKAAIDEMDLPASIEFDWSGNIKMMDETNDDFLITFIIALFLLYMLLAALLENFWHPIILFTTVPMAMIGVFVLLFMTGASMNIMALVAMITLIGLAVNDSILLHDYKTQLAQNGMSFYEATIKAGKTKIKTAIMTSVAIVIGMLPNALGIGDAGAAYRTPMAIVTIGGIITSTVLTLFVIPSIFYVIQNKKIK